MNSILACLPLGLLALGAPRPIQSAPSQPNAASSKESGFLAQLEPRVVARVGAHEVTIGEMLQAARAFYPEARTELDSEYGRAFFDSAAFDGWVDAYVDCLALTRDERVAGQLSPAHVIPPAELLRRALLERAATVDRPPSRLPESAPVDGAGPLTLEVEIQTTAYEQTRRLYGFECARQARLDQLVEPVTDPGVLRQHLIAHPLETVGRVRLRHLLISTRDETTGKRFDRARREQLRRDAEGVASRLRAGEKFEEVVAQVRGKAELRPKDTLPWISYHSTLPAPLLRELFKDAPARENEIIGPIETRDGYYVGLILEQVRARPPEFTRITDQLSRDVRIASQLALLEKVRAAGTVIIY
ncbi:MAG: peptidylprolyl isomerase [Planctomycetes bacterium]|nr:peptidylprolyl isomerase [Planctomycetota bacterium]